MTAIEDVAERAVTAVILFGDLNTAADVRNAAKMVARNVVAEIEPLIRANEQERHGNNCGGMWDEWTHDLRAQVQALEHAPGCQGETQPALCWCPIHRVLALLDGSSE